MTVFYDVATKKKVKIPHEKVKTVTRGGTKFEVATGPKGNKMYKIVGRTRKGKK